jgi:hypothetical protein
VKGTPIGLKATPGRQKDFASINQSSMAIPGLENGGYLLAWEVGRFGSGWALSPDNRETVTGSPMSYALMSDVLSLDELLQLAESVSFD